jgi:hypothetical protein
MPLGTGITAGSGTTEDPNVQTATKTAKAIGNLIPVYGQLAGKLMDTLSKRKLQDILDAIEETRKAAVANGYDANEVEAYIQAYHFGDTSQGVNPLGAAMSLQVMRSASKSEVEASRKRTPTKSPLTGFVSDKQAYTYDGVALPSALGGVSSKLYNLTPQQEEQAKVLGDPSGGGWVVLAAIIAGGLYLVNVLRKKIKTKK